MGLAYTSSLWFSKDVSNVEPERGSEAKNIISFTHKDYLRIATVVSLAPSCAAHISVPN